MLSQPQMCSRCGKYPAILVVQDLDELGQLKPREQRVRSHYCIPCAIETKYGSLRGILKNIGLTPEKVERRDARFGFLFDETIDEAVALEQALEKAPNFPLNLYRTANPSDQEESFTEEDARKILEARVRRSQEAQSQPEPGEREKAREKEKAREREKALEREKEKEDEDAGRIVHGKHEIELTGSLPMGPAVEALTRASGINIGRRKSRNNEKSRYLSMYCTDLTARARDGELDNIVERRQELFRMTQILCRRSKNNPCLIGEPGVGKTAIVESLAHRIASDAVPHRLQGKKIHLLDMTALIAGTQYRGQFEQRIKALIEEVKALGNIILVIDEIHTLVGSGDSENVMNAANILKPALSRGEVQIIGATTFQEYRKHIEKDAALERRLQPITIKEPSVLESQLILNGIKTHYETYHQVKVSDHIICLAAILAERYINDRFLPDKAIDLLDEACVGARFRNVSLDALERDKTTQAALLEVQQVLLGQEIIDYEKLSFVRRDLARHEENIEKLRVLAQNCRVEEQDLAMVIQNWTGIPAIKVMEQEFQRLRELETALSAHVAGQQEAIHVLVSAIQRARLNLRAKRRPASFIFVGATGVGKTELVKRLSDVLFHQPDHLIRVDLSEYMEKHAVSRLIGAPPGYIGYDEAGQLTEKVRRCPYCVVLFDEIEKAHPDVMHLLLQILDEGHIRDAQGRDVSFENAILVMTSNAGSEKKDSVLGFAKTKEAVTREQAEKALKGFLRPEFLGRVDEIIFFRDLTQEDYETIAHIQLTELRDAIWEQGVSLSWRDEAATLIARHAFQGTRGARDVSRVIRVEVEDVLTARSIERGDALRFVSLGARDDALVIHNSFVKDSSQKPEEDLSTASSSEETPEETS